VVKNARSSRCRVRSWRLGSHILSSNAASSRVTKLPHEDSSPALQESHSPGARVVGYCGVRWLTRLCCPPQPVEISALVTTIAGTEHNELTALLESYTSWVWPRSDLHAWIEVLNAFDAVLERIVTDYAVDKLQIAPFKPTDKRLLLEILRFERLLLENSTNRKLFSSYDVGRVLSLCATCTRSAHLTHLIYSVSMPYSEAVTSTSQSRSSNFCSGLRSNTPPSLQSPMCSTSPRRVSKPSLVVGQTSQSTVSTTLTLLPRRSTPRWTRSLRPQAMSSSPSTAVTAMRRNLNPRVLLCLRPLLRNPPAPAVHHLAVNKLCDSRPSQLSVQIP